MSAADWLSPSARRAFTERVRAIEARTAAEIVVAVRARSAAHRHVDLAVGSLAALAALLVYVYHPTTFVDDLAPPAIAACYLAGALLGAAIGPLKRALLTRRQRRAAVRTAAREAFFDRGVGGTCSRVGILVYVSLLEREAEVLADQGVDVGALGEEWTRAVARFEGAVRDGAPVETALAALDALGDLLARAMPVTEDDVNELPDEVAA